MGYKESVRTYKNIDIAKAFCHYCVDLKRVDVDTMEKICQDHEPYEENVWLTEDDIWEYDVPFEAVDWDSYFMEDDDAVRYVMNSLIKKAGHYMVCLTHSTWNGASGYRIVDDVKDVLYRGYDCSIHPVDVSRGGKVLVMSESHHDCPTGHISYVIALTDREYDRMSMHLAWGDLDELAGDVANMVASVA